MTYRIRHAHTAADMAAVAGMWTRASAWLASVGSDQWQYPPRTGRITLSVLAGTCWLVDHDGAPVATITLDHYADPEFWTADDDPDAALYVHRMIVAERGAGLGSALLDWSARQADAAGREYVRLDAWRTNDTLHSYYVGQRFTHVRTVVLPHRGSGALFERHADVRLHAGPVLAG